MEPARSPQRFPIEIRPAVPADLGEMRAVLGRAFADDPIMEYVVSGRPVEPRAGAIMSVFATLHLPDHSVFVATEAGRIVGVAVWGAPGRWKVPNSTFLRHGVTLLRAIGLRSLPKLPALEKMEELHPSAPHWYLMVLGTDPSHQGRGVGTALLEPILQRCDEEGLGAYLESSKESNVAFYGRHRFEVTREYRIGSGPTAYLMWRQPPG